MAIMVGLMAPLGFAITDILAIVIPSIFVAIFAGATVMSFVGKPLDQDVEYLRRLNAGEIEPPVTDSKEAAALKPYAGRSAAIFVTGVLAIVAFGLFPELRPSWVDADGVAGAMSMTQLIQVVMFTAAIMIIVLCKALPKETPASPIFTSGLVAVIALFGVAWMANTFIEANNTEIVAALGGLAESFPLAIAFALFFVAAMTTSQSSTTLAIIPIGITLGIPA
jgi:anaerobic C4-dicarboxylate transporter DcuB